MESVASFGGARMEELNVRGNRELNGAPVLFFGVVPAPEKGGRP